MLVTVFEYISLIGIFLFLISLWYSATNDDNRKTFMMFLGLLGILICFVGNELADNFDADDPDVQQEEKFSMVYNENGIRVWRDNGTNVLYMSNGRSICQLVDPEGNPLLDDGSYDENVEEAVESVN